jgi:hypothetical protein
MQIESYNRQPILLFIMVFFLKYRYPIFAQEFLNCVSYVL